jgi:hypothetical protein
VKSKTHNEKGVLLTIFVNLLVNHMCKISDEAEATHV